MGAIAQGGMTNAAGVGTPCMWAPELWVADECDGHMLDMWACGLIVYQLISGALPFEDIDFDQDLDPQSLMLMFETTSSFGRHAGSVSGPPMPAGVRDVVLSPELQQLLGGLLQPEPNPRFSAVEAMQQPWCDAQCSASAARAKVTAYEASALEVRGATEENLQKEDPNQWVARRGTTTLLQSVHPSQGSPDLRSKGEIEQPGSDEELDAVQAEIAKLKAELGV